MHVRPPTSPSFSDIEIDLPTGKLQFYFDYSFGSLSIHCLEVWSSCLYFLNLFQFQSRLMTLTGILSRLLDLEIHPYVCLPRSLSQMKKKSMTDILKQVLQLVF